jgi:hypothetical protein
MAAHHPLFRMPLAPRISSPHRARATFAPEGKSEIGPGLIAPPPPQVEEEEKKPQTAVAKVRAAQAKRLKEKK